MELLRWPLSGPSLLIFLVFCNPLPWSNLILTKKMPAFEEMSLPMIRLQETVTSVSLVDSLAGFDKANYHAMSCLMEGKEHMSRTEGTLSWQPARNWGPQFNRLQRTESCPNSQELRPDPSLVSLPAKSWILPNTFLDGILGKATGVEDPAKPARIHDPQNLGECGRGCF